jgi:tRNA A-37 threonylcarbamoyl transferase component Bud32
MVYEKSRVRNIQSEMRFLFRNAIIEKNYICCHIQGYHLTVLRESFDEDFLKRCCLEPKKNESGFTPVHSSCYTRIYRFEYNQTIYFHKTYLPRNRMERFKNIFLGNRAQREFKGDLLLQANGFYAPKIVIVGQKGAHNFIVSQMIPSQLPLQQYFRDVSVLPLIEKKMLHRRKTIAELGQIIGRLHSCGLSHGDLRWGNIIIDASDINHFHFVFLDNERTRQYRYLPDRKRLKNLVQLNMIPAVPVSQTDKLRFIKFYLKENPELMTSKKKWIHRVVRKTRRRLALRLLKKGV